MRGKFTDLEASRLFFPSMTTPGVQSTFSNTLLHAGRDNRISNTHNHYGNYVISGADPLTRLQQHAALGALHDAAERPDPPRCHEETRTAILDRIDLWTRDKSIDAKPILWLSGAAGAGKSAIAQTLIERWKEGKLAVPNFFFWRTAARRNQTTYVIPTIAFQLAELLLATKPIIEEAVKDGSIFERNLRSQVEALIVKPLEMAQITDGAVVIVLDGLDECCVNIPKTKDFPGQHYEDQQREILEAIAFACQKIPSLRVLIASRPERQIRKSFAGKPLTSLTLSLSLNNEHQAAADIALYLDCKFAEIRSEHPGINPSWPTKQQIAELVEKSSGQFIYPSTVIKYVSQPRRHPVTSLEEVLALRPRSDRQGGHPLAELDVLYMLVLKTVSEGSLSIVMTLLGLMSYYPYGKDAFRDIHPLGILNNVMKGYNTTCLERFLLLLDGELLTHLTDLHSILSISNDAKDGPTHLGFFHATFSEYLQDKSRSGDFFIGKADVDLQVSLILVRHANGNIEQAEHAPNASICNLGLLYINLASCLPGTPPSKDIMKGLWTHLRDEIGDYSLVSNSNADTGRGTLTRAPSNTFQGSIARYMTSGTKREILNYLKKCNIPVIEPSKSHRRAVHAHLKYLLKLTEPEFLESEIIQTNRGPLKRLWLALLAWFSTRI